MHDELAEKIQRYVQRNSARYGKIFEILPAQGDGIVVFNAPAFIVDCYSDKIFQEITRYKKEFIIIVRNGRITSFLAELFLLNYAINANITLVAGLGTFDFAVLVAKKFVGITMNALAENEMAATLFLESTILAQDAWLELYAIRDGDASLRTIYDSFSRVASEFIFHHEVGHEFTVDTRFKRLIDGYLDTYVSSVQDLDDDLILRIREEIFADLFAVNVIFVKYSAVFNELTMRSFCEAAFCAIIISVVLNSIAQNLFKVNVDPDHITTDLTTDFEVGKHRLAAVTKYIDGFVFDARNTVVCNPGGLNYSTGFSQALIPTILDGSRIVEPITEGTRGILQALARVMVGTPGQITQFIEETRSHRQITKDPVAERFVQDELGKLGGASA